MVSIPPDAVLLRLDDAVRIIEERDCVSRQIDELNGRLSQLNQKVDALRLFLPDEVSKELFGPKDNDSGMDEVYPRQRKWAPVIFPMLTQAGHGLTTSEIKAKLREEHDPLADEIGLHGNALYGALAKMVRKGDLVKDGEYYCLPGQGKPPESGFRQQRSNYEDGIIEALGVAPAGLTSADLISELEKGVVSSGIKRSAGYVYNVLSRMLSEGRLAKEGRFYRLPASQVLGEAQ